MEIHPNHDRRRPCWPPPSPPAPRRSIRLLATPVHPDAARLKWAPSATRCRRADLGDRDAPIAERPAWECGSSPIPRSSADLLPDQASALLTAGDPQRGLQRPGAGHQAANRARYGKPDEPRRPRKPNRPATEPLDLEKAIMNRHLLVASCAGGALPARLCRRGGVRHCTACRIESGGRGHRPSPRPRRPPPRPRRWLPARQPLNRPRLPPRPRQQLAPHGDIADTLRASAQFTILTKALDQTNLTAVLKRSTVR